MKYDMLILNGNVIDGSGGPWFKSDVGIKDGKIYTVGQLKNANADTVVEAKDHIVCPGFIDIHTHDDLHILEKQTVEAKLQQGVTTSVLGNCGFGLFPITKKNKKLFYEYASGLFGEPKGNSFGFKDLDSFFCTLEEKGMTMNVTSLVAHGVLRIAVMGYDEREPSNNELEQMKDLLRKALRSGAVGLSFGLIYSPGAYAKTDELLELSRVVSEEGGIIAAHIRNESERLLESIKEMVHIAKYADVPLQISHLKACGIPNFGKAKKAIELIIEARRDGIDVTFDQYPYLAGSTTATTLLPPWVLEGGVNEMLKRINNPDLRQKVKDHMQNGYSGSAWEPMWRLIGWDNVMVCSVDKQKNKQYEGEFIQAIVDDHSYVSPIDFILDLLEDENGRVMLNFFQQDEEDLETIMVNDLQMFGSDGIPIEGKKAHPRLYGTFPRVLEKYVREDGLLTLEQAIKKMTFMPATRLGLLNRGLIRPGMAADINILDKDAIKDQSTYTFPENYPCGIKEVIVNGEIVLKKGQFLSKYQGQALRKTNANEF